jgi:hypothetical protein
VATVGTFHALVNQSVEVCVAQSTIMNNAIKPSENLPEHPVSSPGYNTLDPSCGAAALGQVDILGANQTTVTEGNSIVTRFIRASEHLR